MNPSFQGQKMQRLERRNHITPIPGIFVVVALQGIDLGSAVAPQNNTESAKLSRKLSSGPPARGFQHRWGLSAARVAWWRLLEQCVCGLEMFWC